MEQSGKQIRVEESTDLAYVTLVDENYLEDWQIRDLQEELLPVVDEVKERRIVIDFTNVRFMSSAFLGLLIRVLKRTSEQNGSLELVNIQPSIRKIFKITSLDKVFDIGKTK
ncbi:MAG: STAS domain-containing protein [Planctomycetota bacterium]